MTVVRDPAHPEFPHGTAAGFQRGCTDDQACPASPSCREDRRRRQNRARKARELGIGQRGVPAAPVLAHVATLRDLDAGVSNAAIAEVAGVSTDVFRIMRQRGTTTRATAAKLLAVTPGQLLDATAAVDAEQVRVLLRTMQACGFPVAWMERRLGMTSTLNTVLSIPQPGAPRRVRRVVRRATYDAVVALAEELAGRMADPERDGLDNRQIACAKAIARRAGYYPPSAYDEDGTVDPRSIPDHPWANADNQAARLLDMAHALCTIGMREGQPAAARKSLGEDSEGLAKMAQRVTDRLGLRWLHPNRKQMIPVELARANAAVIRRVTEVYDRYEAGQIGPITAGLEAGLLTERHLKRFPKEHPEVAPILGPRAGRRGRAAAA